MNNSKCPFCEEVLYSGLGEGCKMCGMPLDEFDEEFCSEMCEKKYFIINKLNTKMGIKS